MKRAGIRGKHSLLKNFMLRNDIVNPEEHFDDNVNEPKKSERTRSISSCSLSDNYKN